MAGSDDKPSAAKEAYARYQASLEAEKAAIKLEPSEWARLRKRLWLLARWPWKWLWMACHDWRIALIYCFWMAALSSEVWVMYIVGLCSSDPASKAWCFGIASACWLWWLGPGTPFMPLCIALTIGTKALFDRAKGKNK
jgi:hypothetical protein